MKPKPITVVALACATLSLMLAPSTAGASIHPEAREIIDAHIDAIGGKKLLESFQYRVLKGTISMPAQGMTLSMTAYIQAPNRMAVHTDLPGMGVSRSGFDGVAGWEQNPITGFRMIEGDELHQLKRHSNIAMELHLESLYESIVRLEDEDEFKVLELTSTNGKSERWFFDAKTHRLAKTDMVMDAGPMGSIPVQVLVEDYRPVDGLMIAFRTVLKNPAFEAITQYTSITHPDTLDPALFRAPDPSKSE